ncbi:MAG TPA: sulfite exporter TauE/SafE family protein [Actinomycetota bacterium]|nr:sulfite exporter TauE/SafE family protein [Actinomycetota bacterium]
MDATWLLLVPIGLIVGIFSAAFGIGGGLLMAPVLVLAYGFEQHAAQGTSLAVIVPTALAGAIAHHRRGFVDLKLALLMAAAGVPGVLIGARIALATEEDALRAVFGAVMIVAGVRLALKALGPRRDAADGTDAGSE